MSGLRIALAASLLALGGCTSLGTLGGGPAWEAAPPAIKTGALVPADRLERATLPNGMHAILLEDRRVPLVRFGITLRRGAASVPAEQAGLTAFTAELLERGAGERDALELAQTIDAMGATLSASASWDSMDVQITGLSRDADALLDLLGDVVLRPRFDAGEAQKVRDQQLAGLERAKDEPRTLASWQFSRSLYGDHPYGQPIGGTPESVAEFAAADARALHQSFFVASNAIFHASGDVDRALLLPRVIDTFGDWATGTPPPAGAAPPDPTPAARRIVIVDRPELSQAQIILGHEGIERSNPDRIAVGLLETVVGSGGFSSRLMTRVRADAGLTYSVYAGFSMRREGGPFAVSTFTRVAEVRTTLDLLLSVLAEARTAPPTADELRHAQSYRVGRFSLALETSSAVTDSLVSLDVHGLPEDSLDTYRARVAAVTPADTARLAQALLDPGRTAIVVVGPAEALRPQLADLGPVEVVAP